MSTEQNKEIVRQFHQFYNQGNLDAAKQLLTHDFVGYIPGTSSALSRDEFKNMGEAYLAAFPDSRSETLDLIAEGNTVAAHGVFHGTNLREFMGIPATGKSFTMGWVHFFRVSDGKSPRSAFSRTC